MGVKRFTPDSAAFDLVSGFAFFVEIATADVAYHRSRGRPTAMLCSASLQGRAVRG